MAHPRAALVIRSGVWLPAAFLIFLSASAMAQLPSRAEDSKLRTEYIGRATLDLQACRNAVYGRLPSAEQYCSEAQKSVNACQKYRTDFKNRTEAFFKERGMGQGGVIVPACPREVPGTAQEPREYFLADQAERTQQSATITKCDQYRRLVDRAIDSRKWDEAQKNNDLLKSATCNVNPVYEGVAGIFQPRIESGKEEDSRKTGNVSHNKDVGSEKCVSLIDQIATAHKSGDKSKARSALDAWAETCKDMPQHAALLAQLRALVDPSSASGADAPANQPPQLIARRGASGSAALAEGVNKAARGDVGMPSNLQGATGSSSTGAEQFFKIVGAVAQAYIDTQKGGSSLSDLGLPSGSSNTIFGSDADTASAGSTLEPAAGVGSGGCDADLSAINSRAGNAGGRAQSSTEKLEAAWWGFEQMIRVIDTQCPGDPVKARQRASFVSSLAGVKQTCAQISSRTCSPRLP
jgi:hypothetical protein